MSGALVTGPPWPSDPFLVDLDRLGALTLVDLASLERGQAPCVGVIRGPCEGSALAAALAVDLLVAGPLSSFGKPGRWADVVVRRGSGVIGRKAAAYLTMTQRSIDAWLGARWGLVSQVADDPERSAREILERIAARSAVAVATIRAQAHRGAVADYRMAALADPGEPAGQTS